MVNQAFYWVGGILVVAILMAVILLTRKKNSIRVLGGTPFGKNEGRKNLSGKPHPRQHEPDAEADAQEKRRNEAKLRADALVKMQSRLSEAKQSAETAAADVVFSRLFERLANPIQSLLGFAASGKDMTVFKTKAGVRIQAQINEALRSNKATIEAGLLNIPLDVKPLDLRLLKDKDSLTEYKISEAIKYYEDELKRSGVFQVTKAIVEAADSDLCKLTQTPLSDFSAQDISDIAQRLQAALEKNNIHPMYKHDSRLSDRGDLRGLFVEIHDEAIAIPGLFVYENDQWYIFGNHQGYCHKEDT